MGIWIGGGFGFLWRIVDNPKDKAMSMDLINNQERGLSPDRIVHLLRILHNLLTKPSKKITSSVGLPRFFTSNWARISTFVESFSYIFGLVFWLKFSFFSQSWDFWPKLGSFSPNKVFQFTTLF